MFYTLLVIIISIICVLLTIAVLLQSGQGDGLSGIAAGGAATQMMGQRRAADFLSKATTYLGGAFLVLCIIANFFIRTGTQTQSTIQQQAGTNTETPLNNNFNQPSQSPAAIPSQNGASGTKATPQTTPPKQNSSKKPTGK